MYRFEYTRAYGSDMYGPSTRSERVRVSVLAENQDEAARKVRESAADPGHGYRYYLTLHSVTEEAALAPVSADSEARR